MSCFQRWTFKRSFSRKGQTVSREQGLKLLYEGVDPKVDIIAVHGLNGHREKSWTAANGTNWLQSLLPLDLPDSRIYTWGYAVSTEKENGGKFWQETVSESLISELWQARETTNVQKPKSINNFVAHSLGGTVVKHALSYSESLCDGPLKHFRGIKESTHGVFLMSTPELETRMEGLRSYLAGSEGDGQRTTDSYKEAKWMLKVLDQFSTIKNQFDIVIVSESDGPKSHNDAQMIHALNSMQATRIFICTDHDGIIKFESASDPGYQKIKMAFQAMTADIRNRPIDDFA